MIEPQSEQAGLSAVSKITVGCPFSRRSVVYFFVVFFAGGF